MFPAQRFQLNQKYFIAKVMGAILFATPTAHAWIIGGPLVAVSETIASSTVSLTANSQDCTGSIIAPDLILTAAHCVFEVAPSQVHVKFSGGRIPYAVSGYVIHPKYSEAETIRAESADQYDLAILKLEKAVPPGSRVANLLNAQTPLNIGAPVSVAGFGANDAKTLESDHRLHRANLRIRAFLGQTEVVVDQSHGQGACHGDSGGPAFLEVAGVQMLWGVTSRMNREPYDCRTSDMIYYANFKISNLDRSICSRTSSGDSNKRCQN